MGSSQQISGLLPGYPPHSPSGGGTSSVAPRQSGLGSDTIAVVTASAVAGILGATLVALLGVVIHRAYHKHSIKKAFREMKTLEDFDRIFQRLYLPDKELLCSVTVKDRSHSWEKLKAWYKKFLILMKGKLSPAMQEGFEEAAKERFGMDATSLSPPLVKLVKSKQFQDLSEAQQVQEIDKFFDAHKESEKALVFEREVSMLDAEWPEKYFERCLQPHVSRTVGRSILVGWRDGLSLHR